MCSAASKVESKIMDVFLSESREHLLMFLDLFLYSFVLHIFFRRFVLIFKFVGNSNYQTTTLNGLGKGLDAYVLWCLVNLSTLPGV